MSNCEFAEQHFGAVNQRIDKACQAAGRERNSVRLIGASKKKEPSLLQFFHQVGLNDLGENYLQEAIAKQEVLDNCALNWHFIGSIQSNKTKLIAKHFNWVHGVDRIKIAQRLARQNPHKAPIKILIQLNPDLEDSKAGVALTSAGELADAIAQIRDLELHGFMMIPMSREKQSEQRRVFAKARKTLESTNQRYGLNLQHLSMGMSGDLEAAVAEGSTMLRIGTDLFGART